MHAVLWVTVGVLAFVGLLSLHIFYWAHVYRLRLDSDEVLKTSCADGWELAVSHFRPNSPTNRLPVVLCHGLSANRFNLCLPGRHSVAAFLQRAGYETFVCDLRGAGDSRHPPPGRKIADIDFDAHLFQDAPAVVDLALKVTGAKQAFWVGHSMGGLLGLALAETEHASKLAGVVAIGSPTRFTFHEKWLGQLLRLSLPLAIGGRVRQRWLLRLIAPWLGYVPLPNGTFLNPRNMTGLVNRLVAYHVLDNPPRKLLGQFESWMRRDAWDTQSPPRNLLFDLKNIQCPVLLMGGSRDHLSPPKGMEAALQDLGTHDKSLIILGRDRGDAQDYGHGDLVFGDRAPDEVFPLVERWLSSHAPSA
jgi:pimeloyl-ACP methyl ester carboxylesterase